MRVIAGLCRGRRLKTLKGFNTRPTADRVKEAIYNVLREKVVDSVVLDLFAGTGNIGIEALSRGAKLVVFVEKNPNAYKVLKNNIRECNFEETSEVLLLDALEALKILREKKLKFNLIYLDPPYGSSVLEKTLERIINSFLLTNKGIVVVETAKDTDLKINYSSLKKIRETKYGDTKIIYYQLMEEEI